MYFTLVETEIYNSNILKYLELMKVNPNAIDYVSKFCNYHIKDNMYCNKETKNYRCICNKHSKYYNDIDIMELRIKYNINYKSIKVFTIICNILDKNINNTMTIDDNCYLYNILGQNICLLATDKYKCFLETVILKTNEFIKNVNKENTKDYNLYVKNIKNIKKLYRLIKNKPYRKEKVLKDDYFIDITKIEKKYENNIMIL